MRKPCKRFVHLQRKRSEGAHAGHGVTHHGLGREPKVLSPILCTFRQDGGGPGRVSGTELEHEID